MDTKPDSASNDQPSIADIRLAASRVGVNPAFVNRIVDQTGNSPVWSAFYALSKRFACNPAFTHADSCRYADVRMGLLDSAENSIYAALMKNEGTFNLNGVPISHIRTEGDTVTLCRQGLGECHFDKIQLMMNPMHDHGTIIDLQQTHFSLNTERKSDVIQSNLSDASIKSWREDHGSNSSKDKPLINPVGNSSPRM